MDKLPARKYYMRTFSKEEFRLEATFLMGWGPARFHVLQVHQPVVQLKMSNKLATYLIYEAPTKLKVYQGWSLPAYRRVQG